MLLLLMLPLKEHSDHLAPVWVISISPFITFIVAVMKHGACLHKALTGLCLFNTFLSLWQVCTNLIYPEVTVANITVHTCPCYYTYHNTSHKNPDTYMNMYICKMLRFLLLISLLLLPQIIHSAFPDLYEFELSLKRVSVL